MKDSTTKGLSAQALEPLVKYCAKHRGTTTQIVAKLTTMTGQTQYRQNVEEWLNVDPKRRVEPRLGIGLCLLIIGAGYTGPTEVRSNGLVTRLVKGVPVRRPVPSARKRAVNRPRKRLDKSTRSADSNGDGASSPVTKTKTICKTKSPVTVKSTARRVGKSTMNPRRATRAVAPVRSAKPDSKS